jgi:hypothetical protein
MGAERNITDKKLEQTAYRGSPELVRFINVITIIKSSIGMAGDIALIL